MKLPMKTKIKPFDKLRDFLKTHESVAYNEEKKSEFKRLSAAAMKEIKADLEYSDDVKNCTISYNKAGIACSGDVSLKGDFTSGGSFHFFYNLDCGNRFFIYRKTMHQKDYTGEMNRYIPFDNPKEAIVQRILMLSTSREEL